MMTLNLSIFFEKLALIRDIRNYPVDLKVALLWTIGTILCVYIPFLQDSVLRPVFGVLFLLIVPGYLFTAALFPASDDIEWIERIALTFGLSIAVVPLIGLGLNYSPWGIRLTPIVTALVIFTLAMIGIAAYRRLILPEENRFFVPIHETIQGIWSEFFPDHTTRIDRALSILLFGAIVILITTTVFVILFPQDGERFTEFYILGEKGKAADYPTTFWNGTRQEITVGIGNHEHRNVTYDVEIYGLNQQFDISTNTSEILKAVPLGSYSIEVAHNETVERSFPFMVNDTSINRIQLLLFDDVHRKPDGDLPIVEMINSSYQDLHFWVEVDEAQPFFRSVDRVIGDRVIDDNGGFIDLSGEWEWESVTTKTPHILQIIQKNDQIHGFLRVEPNNILYRSDPIFDGKIENNIIQFKREFIGKYYNTNEDAIQQFSGVYVDSKNGKGKIVGIYDNFWSNNRVETMDFVFIKR